MKKKVDSRGVAIPTITGMIVNQQGVVLTYTESPIIQFDRELTSMARQIGRHNAWIRTLTPDEQVRRNNLHD